MTLCKFIATACSASLLMVAAPVFAADTPAPAAAAKAAAPAKPPVKPVKLTQQDINKICKLRAAGAAKKEANCIDNHKDKVGKESTVAEARQLNNIDQKIAKMEKNTKAAHKGRGKGKGKK